MSETIEQTATVVTAQPVPIEMSITTGTLSEMFLSLDGHDKTQPGYDWRKGWNDAIRQAMDYAQPAPSVPDGFSREDLEAVADGLDGYEKTVNVGNVTGGGDDHLESTTAYAARFIRAMLAAAPEAKP